MTEQNGKQYPLMDHHPEDISAASGRNINDINVDALLENQLSSEDLRIQAKTLRIQAQIAESAGHPQLARNLRRAAELTAVPNEEMLHMYEMIRPGRASYEELTALAEKLESEYNAPENGKLVREAAEVYRSRNLLKLDS